jgi:hypothetical protein
MFRKARSRNIQVANRIITAPLTTVPLSTTPERQECKQECKPEVGLYMAEIHTTNFAVSMEKTETEDKKVITIVENP